MKVSHDVGESWGTSVTTQMRIFPEITIGGVESSVKIKKTYLQNINGGLNKIEEYLDFIGNLEPVKIQRNTDGKLPSNIDYIFRAKVTKDTIKPFDLPPMTTTSADESGLTEFASKIENLNTFIDTKSGDFTEKVKLIDALETISWPNDPNSPLSIKEITYACNIKIEFTQTSEDINLFIITSGKNWIMLPFDPSNEWQKFEEFFQLVKITPPSVEVEALESTAESLNLQKGEQCSSNADCESGICLYIGLDVPNANTCT